MKGGVDAFQKMVERRAIERVEGSDIQGGGKPKCYLPWRIVVNPENNTTTYRLVMDASARPSKKEFSLNQCLLKGPNMVMNLAKCLVRFRLGKYRVVSDLKKAFLNIKVKKGHRDALRFFWPKNPEDPNSPLEVWRYRVVLFGSIYKFSLFIGNNIGENYRGGHSK